MTVKELINGLLDCPMDADVEVLVELHKDFIKDRLDNSTYTFPVDNDVNIEYVYTVFNGLVRVVLEDTSEWQ